MKKCEMRDKKWEIKNVRCEIGNDEPAILLDWKRHRQASTDSLMWFYGSNAWAFKVLLWRVCLRAKSEISAQISEEEITFLDTVVYKGERFQNESILDIKTYFKPTETFQYTHYSSCHPPGVMRGFIKGGDS